MRRAREKEENIFIAIGYIFFSMEFLKRSCWLKVHCCVLLFLFHIPFMCLSKMPLFFTFHDLQFYFLFLCFLRGCKCRIETPLDCTSIFFPIRFLFFFVSKEEEAKNMEILWQTLKLFIKWKHTQWNTKNEK